MSSGPDTRFKLIELRKGGDWKNWYYQYQQVMILVHVETLIFNHSQ